MSTNLLLENPKWVTSVFLLVYPETQSSNTAEGYTYTVSTVEFSVKLTLLQFIFI